jgi:hypothetical protein
LVVDPPRLRDFDYAKSLFCEFARLFCVRWKRRICTVYEKAFLQGVCASVKTLLITLLLIMTALVGLFAQLIFYGSIRLEFGGTWAAGKVAQLLSLLMTQFPSSLPGMTSTWAP